MDFDKIDNAIDLLRATVRQNGDLSALLALENSMTPAERCRYAFTIAAEASGLSIEEFESKHNLTEEMIETADNKTRDTFVAAARLSFSNAYKKQVAADMALKLLQSPTLKQLGPEGVETIGTIVLANAPAPRAGLS